MLEFVTPGAPFAPRASDWNSFVESARRERGTRSIFKPGPLSVPEQYERMVVWIQERTDESQNKYFAELANATAMVNTANNMGGESFEISLAACTGVYFSGQKIKISQISMPDVLGSVWTIDTPGVSTFANAVAETDISGVGDARITYKGNGAFDGFVATECVVPVIAWDPTYAIAAGARVVVQYEESNGQFYALHASCPVLSEY